MQYVAFLGPIICSFNGYINPFEAIVFWLVFMCLFDLMIDPISHVK